ncbi:MAG: nucleotidyltransferase domain-containing protein [Geminocystis sp.]
MEFLIFENNMIHPQLEEIISKLKQSFINLYNTKLDKIILYGSQGRKDAQIHSDIDILVVLKGNIDPYKEIDRTGDIIYQISLDYDVVLSRHFISSDKFNHNNNPFLHNVKKEGIIL